MWVFVPRVPPGTLLLAVAVAAPAVLLGALGNLLVLSELAALDVWPAAGSSVDAWQALVAFREHVSVLLVGLFVVLGLATFTVVRLAPHAVVALNVWGTLLLALLTLVVLGGWTLGGPDQASARIGLGAAFWGVAWGLVVLDLFAFLNPARHRHWVWVTLGMGLLYGLATLTAMVLGVWVSVEVVALLLLILCVMAGFVVVVRRGEVQMLWGFDPARQASPPQTESKNLPLVVGYLVLVFGLMGASYQHHFDYRPQAGMGHFVLMGLGFFVGVPAFGALMRRTSRRTLLLLVPLAAFVPMILQLVQQQHDVLWAVVLTEGVMMGSFLFVLQYFVEVAAKITRPMAVACGMGVVLVIGAGGSLVAQLSALEAFTADLLLSLQFAAFFSAMLVAMALPEVKEAVRREEEIEEYLEVAKRVSQQVR